MPSALLRALLALALSLSLLPAAAAQDEPLAPPSAAAISSRIAGLPQDLDEAARKRAADAYGQAIEVLTRAGEHRLRAEESLRRGKAAPEEVAQIRQRLATWTAQDPEILPSAGLRELEEGLVESRAAVERARAQVEDLRRQLSRRSERRRALGEDQARLREVISGLREAIKGAEPNSEPARAEYTLKQTQIEAANAELAAAVAELSLDDAVISARLDLARRELEGREVSVTAWEKRTLARRSADAAAESKRAKDLLNEAARASPQLKAIADQTSQLTERRIGPQGLNARREAVDKGLRATATEIHDLKTRFSYLRRRLKAGGPRDSLGYLLRREREGLPTAGRLAAARRALEEEIGKTQSELLEYEDARVEAGDVERILTGLVESTDDPETKSVYREVGREILTSRRDLLDALRNETQRLLEQELLLNRDILTLSEASTELRIYVEERIFWFPSVFGPWLPSGGDLAGGLRWLTEPWTPADYAALGRAAPGPALSVLLILVLVVVTVWAFRHPAEDTGVRSWTRALRRAAPLVLISLLGVGFALHLEGLGPTPRAAALGAVIRTLSLYGAAMAVAWRLSGGASSAVLQQRGLLLLLALPFLGASAVAVAMEHAPDPAWRDSLGRLAFLLAMAFEAASLALAFRQDGLLGSILRDSEGLTARLAPWATYFAAAFPTLLAGFAIGSYYYTALHLQVRFEGTLLALLGAVFAYDALLAAFTPTEAAKADEVSAALSSTTHLSAAQIAAALEAANAPVSAADGSEPTERAALTSQIGSSRPRLESASEGSAARPEAEELRAKPEAGSSVEPDAGSSAEPERASAPEAGSSAEPERAGASAVDSRSESASPAPASVLSASEDETASSLSPSETERSDPAEVSDPTASQASLPPAARALGETWVPAAPTAAAPTPETVKSVELTTSAPRTGLDPEELARLELRARHTVRVLVAATLIASLAVLWADVLPALGRLRGLQIYPSFKVLELQTPDSNVLVETPEPAPSPSAGSSGAAPGPSGGMLPGPKLTAPAASAGGEHPLVVTVADLGLSILLLGLTILLARSLPGALEFALVGRLPLDAGARYAVSTVVGYAVVVIGVYGSSRALGVGWDQVQWLAAALTFGLAFGLQEIFANFVSGLILLFERPVRVGDVVTLGDVTGRVSRIRIRATTILDWNRKELIVPNKELVTGKVVNWTLTESVTRTVIPIGIAYGSDVTRAQELIMQAATEQPLVMTDPPPACFFEAFADSYYDLQLRIWLPQPGQTPSVRDALLKRIAFLFAQEGIEISFPQRDLHLRSSTAVLRVETRGRSEVD